MALFILQEGVQPIGDFNVAAASAAYVKGGELMTLASELANDYLSAMDVNDGYVAPQAVTAYAQVPCVRLAYDTGELAGPIYLSDDGTTHYGVMFGTIIGNPVGIGTDYLAGVAHSGTNLGPSTMTGSGKCTCWDKPGIYAVSLDACDQTALGLGVMATELNDTLAPGTSLFRSNGNSVTTGGRLTISGVNCSSSNAVASFIELTDSGALVRTPARMVGATAVYDRVKIQFFGASSCYRTA